VSNEYTYAIAIITRGIYLLDNSGQDKTRVNLGGNGDLNDSIMDGLLVGGTVWCAIDCVLQVESPHVVEVDPLVDRREVRQLTTTQDMKITRMSERWLIAIKIASMYLKHL
jgi:hypothetical protein